MLKNCLDPPPPSTVDAAVAFLLSLGALCAPPRAAARRRAAAPAELAAARPGPYGRLLSALPVNLDEVPLLCVPSADITGVSYGLNAFVLVACSCAAIEVSTGVRYGLDPFALVACSCAAIEVSGGIVVVSDGILCRLRVCHPRVSSA